MTYSEYNLKQHHFLVVEIHMPLEEECVIYTKNAGQSPYEEKSLVLFSK